MARRSKPNNLATRSITIALNCFREGQARAARSLRLAWQSEPIFLTYESQKTLSCFQPVLNIGAYMITRVNFRNDSPSHKRFG
jgi:hypothetical protein